MKSNETCITDKAMGHVMAREKEEWLNCFASDALLLDPVGGSPIDPNGEGFQGRSKIASFWDAIVTASDSVEFEIREQHASGNCIAKVATVRLELKAGKTVSYDGVFLYELNDTGLIQKLSGIFQFPDLA